MSWEADGARRDVRLRVAELVRGGALQDVGLWAPGAGVLWQRPPDAGVEPPGDSMTNRTFNVLIALVSRCLDICRSVLYIKHE